VGYAIRFEDVTGPNTIIKVVLLHHLWLLLDLHLSTCSCREY
jgi:hypothetical protein